MLGPEWELTLESGQELACNPVAMLAQCMCCWPRVPGGAGGGLASAPTGQGPCHTHH